MQLTLPLRAVGAGPRGLRPARHSNPAPDAGLSLGSRLRAPEAPPHPAPATRPRPLAPRGNGSGGDPGRKQEAAEPDHARGGSGHEAMAEKFDHLEEHLEKFVENIRQLGIIVSDFQPSSQAGLNQKL